MGIVKDYLADGAVLVISGATLGYGGSPNGKWADLNTGLGCSALVILSFTAEADMNATSVRTKGDSDEFYNTAVEVSAYGCALGHHDSSAVLVLMCGTDTQGMIQWITEDSQIATVKLLAYIK